MRSGTDSVNVDGFPSYNLIQHLYSLLAHPEPWRQAQKVTYTWDNRDKEGVVLTRKRGCISKVAQDSTKREPRCQQNNNVKNKALWHKRYSYVALVMWDQLRRELIESRKAFVCFDKSQAWGKNPGTLEMLEVVHDGQRPRSSSQRDLAHRVKQGQINALAP